MSLYYFSGLLCKESYIRTVIYYTLTHNGKEHLVFNTLKFVYVGIKYGKLHPDVYILVVRSNTLVGL